MIRIYCMLVQAEQLMTWYAEQKLIARNCVIVEYNGVPDSGGGAAPPPWSVRFLE